MNRIPTLARLLVLILLLCFQAVLTSAQTFNVATYNLRNDNKGDALKGDGWKDRLPVVSSLIRFHGFDIFGIQEGFYHQLTDLKAQLPGYAFTGVGRDDGQQGGEHAAIFYDQGKFDLLDHGDFWLSQDPTNPNKGWDAALPRICSWAKLKVKGSKKTFYFFNIHFDHIGVEARKESSKLILSRIKEMAKNHSTILTGDFNIDQHNESYLLLNTSGVLEDSFDKAALKYAVTGTFNNFDPNTKTESRIDHIFLTSDFKVSKYGVLTDTYRSAIQDKNVEYSSGNFPKEVKLKDYRARVPSDHFPVMATVSFK